MSPVPRKPVFRGDSNWPALLQKLASLEILDLASIDIILYKNNKGADCPDVQADLRLCCSYMG